MEIVGLVWDDEEDVKGNVHHIWRHRVTTGEVREVVESAPLFLREADVTGPNPVYVAVGYTATGRLLEVWGILFQAPPLSGWWRTITAFDARPRFHQRYLEERGGR